MLQSRPLPETANTQIPACLAAATAWAMPCVKTGGAEKSMEYILDASGQGARRQLLDRGGPVFGAALKVAREGLNRKLDAARVP